MITCAYFEHKMHRLLKAIWLPLNPQIHDPRF